MGVKQAVAHCCRVLDTLLRDMPNVQSYVDDCIVYHMTPRVFIQSVERFLQVMKKANLALSPKKTHFKHHCVFVGQLVNRRGTQIDPQRIEALRSVPRPINAAALWSFLSSASWVRKMCIRFTEIAAPLTNLPQEVRVEVKHRAHG